MKIEEGANKTRVLLVAAFSTSSHKGEFSMFLSTVPLLYSVTASPREAPEAGTVGTINLISQMRKLRYIKVPGPQMKGGRASLHPDTYLFIS